MINNYTGYAIINGGVGNDSIDNSGEYATINGGDGNDSIYNSGRQAIVIGGAGNDTIENYGGYSSIDGREGSDYVINVGSFVIIDGGSGADSIDNLGEYATINGGDGDDSVHSTAVYATSINGGGGNDFIEAYGEHSSIIGGSDDDSIYAGDYANVHGDSGNDYVFTYGDYASASGGTGNDTLRNLSDYAVITGDDGDDLIYNYHDNATDHLTGNHATLSGGTGIDTIYGDGSTAETFIHSADTDIIYGFGSGDTLSLESGTVTSSVVSGSDVILTTSNNGSIILKNTALGNVVFNNGWIGYQTVSGSESVSGSTLTGSGSIITATDGNDTIYVDGSIATIRTSSGSSTISVGMNDTIDAGAGNDVVSVISGSNLYIAGGDGADSISTRYAIESLVSSLTVDGGDGDDYVYIWGSSYTSINGGSGNDSIFNVGDYASIDGGAGNDSIYNVGTYANVYGEDGDDTIYAYGSNIDGGSGNDYIYDNGSYSNIYGGSGNDTISSNSDYSSIFGENGDDSIYSYGSYSSIFGGSGSDIIEIWSSYSTIDGEDGDDSIHNWIGKYASIYGGDGNDSIFNLIGSYSSINGGYGNDTIHNASTAEYTDIFGGDGNDSILNQGSYASIDGGVGIDTIQDEGRYTTFIHSADTDIIYGFGSGDTLSIESGTVTSSVVSGSDVILTTSNDGSIILKNVSSSFVQIGQNVINGSESVSGSTVSGSGSTISGSSIGSNEVDTTPSDSIFATDENDSIYVQGTSVTIQNSSGTSTFAIGSNATINAGAGNDVVSVISGSNFYIVTGDGIDTVTNGGTYTTVFGGDGSDSIVNNGGGALDDYGDHVVMYAGNGNDSIYNYAGYYIGMNGEDGDDYIYNSNGVHPVTINGGAGNDSIYSAGYMVSIHGGAGNDSIYNIGTLTTINAGTGIDTIQGQTYYAETFIHSADTDIIYGFGTGDTLSIESGTVTSSVQSGSDVLLTTDLGSIVLKNTQIDDVSINGNAVNYIGSDTSNNTIVSSYIYATDENDTLINDGNNVTVTSGSYSFYAVHGSGAYLDGGGGNDVLSVVSGEDLYVLGGSGNDSIFNSGNSISLSGDSGSDYIQNISGNLVTLNGGDGHNTLVGNDSNPETFIYTDGRDLIQNFGIGDSLDIGSHVISSSVVADEGIVLRFDHNGALNVTIEGAGSENLNIENGIITYTATEDVDYEYVPIFGSDIGSDSGSELISSSNGSMTSRTIIRLVGDEMISVESNFRTEDIKFAYYGSDGEMYTQPYRGSETRAFVALNDNNAEFVANPNSSENLGFRSEGSVDSWNVSLGAGNDLIHVDDVSSGIFDGGSGTDYFHVTRSLKSNVTLTGGNDSWNFYYATSGVVSSQSDQARITITDIDFDSGDVILTDAGVQNLTGDFFSQGKFYNFSNARHASVSGAIARNVFDASDIVSTLGMDFSMARFANRSDAKIGSSMSIENVVNVIWVNDSASVIELADQTGSILFFTDSNNVGDQLYLGSQNFDDTIHAGFNDTIDGGGGNDQIYVGSSTNVIYSAGNDTIMNWNSSAVIDLNDLASIPAISVSGENLLIGSTTINQVAGSDVQYRFDDEIGIVRVGNSSGNVNYGSEITYYAGSILILDTDQNTVIDLSDSRYENISVIDAANGSGADRFIYESGNITIQNGDSTDIIDLSNYSFDEVSTQFTSSGLILTMDNSSLNVEGTSLTSFHFADGTRTADFTNQTF